MKTTVTVEEFDEKGNITKRTTTVTEQADYQYQYPYTYPYLYMESGGNLETIKTKYGFASWGGSTA